MSIVILQCQPRSKALRTIQNRYRSSTVESPRKLRQPPGFKRTSTNSARVPPPRRFITHSAALSTNPTKQFLKSTAGHLEPDWPIRPNHQRRLRTIKSTGIVKIDCGGMFTTLVASGGDNGRWSVELNELRTSSVHYLETKEDTKEDCSSRKSIYRAIGCMVNHSERRWLFWWADIFRADHQPLYYFGQITITIRSLSFFPLEEDPEIHPSINFTKLSNTIVILFLFLFVPCVWV